jgi:hypothetical protein
VISVRHCRSCNSHFRLCLWQWLHGRPLASDAKKQLHTKSESSSHRRAAAPLASLAAGRKPNPSPGQPRGAPSPGPSASARDEAVRGSRSRSRDARYLSLLCCYVLFAISIMLHRSRSRSRNIRAGPGPLLAPCSLQWHAVPQTHPVHCPTTPVGTVSRIQALPTALFNGQTPLVGICANKIIL